MQQLKNRRGFLKAGLGMVASVTALTAVSETASSDSQTTVKESAGLPNEQKKWVACGYLMSRPQGSTDII